MSLVNDMLRDLERRLDGRPSPGPTARLAPAVPGPGPGPVRRQRLLVMALAGVAGFALAGLARVPDPVEGPSAVRALQPAEPASAVDPVAASPVPGRAAEAGPAPAAPAQAPAAAPDPGPPVLRMTRELRRPPAPPRQPPTVEAFIALLEQAPPGALGPPEAPPPAPVVTRTPVPANPAERAEAQFREGVAALRGGRDAEGEAALAAALDLWPAHGRAREVLAARALGAGRLDAAEGLLAEGLARAPGSAALNRLYARLELERGDLQGALARLAAGRAAAGADPDYQGFHAALLARAGRHREAADAYRVALLARPAEAAWWLGLGISLEALDERADALRAYRQAGGGALSAEVERFIDARVAALAGR